MVKRAALLAGLALLAAVIWSTVAHPWGWLYGFGVHPYPASSDTPWTYQLLSGMIPALTALSLLTLLAGAWRHFNCHVDGCPRLGRYAVAGGHFKVCRGHHPDDAVRGRAVSHLHIQLAHRAHLDRSP
jgi:hypothetical protein